MLAVLDIRLPGRRDELSRDPVEVLRSWTELTYREVPLADTGDRCSVAGAYYGTEEPPLLTVADAISRGRKAFTALHELGHDLQQSNLDLAETVDLHGDNAEIFEDAACDAFAADVLLPEELAARHLPDGTPTADHVVALYRDSAASRAAVCVRAAQRLTLPGHVLLLDADGVLQFAASHLMPRPARGSDQSRAPVIARALTTATGRGRARGRTRLRYRDGIQGDELYAQAVPMDGYLVVVAVTDHAPWEGGFVLPIAQTGAEAPWRTCEHLECGREFQSFDASCTRCGVPACPECGRCGCPPAVPEKRCSKCFTVYPLSYFEGDHCRECA
jgi:Zn-dependent peptidase ImmA (M78 family)